jgi:hypothetical protein
MRTMHHLGLPVLVLLAIPLIGQDVRDTRPGAPAPAPVGTSRISGRVVAADTGTPVKRATVNIFGRPLVESSGRGQAAQAPFARGGRGGSFPPHVTDETGRFEFSDLPAGVYSIMVMPRGGFVRLPRPEMIEVADGHTASLTIKLNRTGVISGRLLDESGEPLSRARVSAMRREPLAGSRLLPAGMADTSDDLGQVRLFDLPPGEYIVTAQDFSGPAEAADGSQGYAPTYYPGSPSLDGARPVSVRAAQETPGIEFSLARVVMGRITGTVRDSGGQVVSGRGGNVSLVRRADETMGSTRGGVIRPDGSFVIGQVPPGEYYLMANVSIGEGGPNTAREGAYVPVAVNGNEVSVDVQTNKGATVRGRVIVEGTPPAASPEMAARPDAARVSVSSRPMTIGPLGMVTGGARPATAGEDGTFELTGLRGPLLLTASGMRMALRSITHGAEDLTASPMEFKGTERVNNVSIVMTYDVGTIEGTVTDDAGQPAPGATVIIFPDDEDRWFRGSPFVHYARSMPAVQTSGSRSPAAERPGLPVPDRSLRAAGSFTSTGLLPGRYLVAAIDGEGGVTGPMDREPMERLRKHAVVATVTTGASSSVQLRVLKTF